MERDDDLRVLWQSQPSAEPARLTDEEIRQRVERMEKHMRRQTMDLYAALILSSIVILGLAALFPHPAMTAGAVLILCGFGYLAYEIRQARRSAPAAVDGAPAVDHQRALLRHRLDFHRKRLWLRVAALTPGGILYFTGFAAARPDLAPLIYVQLATFLLIMAAMVPLNRRHALHLQRQIDDLDRLQ